MGILCAWLPFSRAYKRVLGMRPQNPIDRGTFYTIRHNGLCKYFQPCAEIQPPIPSELEPGAAAPDVQTWFKTGAGVRKWLWTLVLSDIQPAFLFQFHLAAKPNTWPHGRQACVPATGYRGCQSVGAKPKWYATSTAPLHIFLAKARKLSRCLKHLTVVLSRHFREAGAGHEHTS